MEEAAPGSKHGSNYQKPRRSAQGLVEEMAAIGKQSDDDRHAEAGANDTHTAI